MAVATQRMITYLNIQMQWILKAMSRTEKRLWGFEIRNVKAQLQDDRSGSIKLESPEASLRSSVSSIWCLYFFRRINTIKVKLSELEEDLAFLW